MIKKVEMFTMVCDNCGNVLECNGIVAWTDDCSAKEMAMENGFIKHGIKDICEKCWQYDDNDNIVIKKLES